MLSDELTIPCFGSIKAGDTVHVQLVDGVPTAIGATGWGDDVSGRADAAQDAAEGAQAAAEGAQAAADAIGQHVWQDGSGVHVSEYEQDAPENGKHESLFNSLGMLIRKRVGGAMRTLASFTQGGVAFYDGSGDAAANVVASFGAEGAQIGKSALQHAAINDSGISLVKEQYDIKARAGVSGNSAEFCGVKEDAGRAGFLMINGDSVRLSQGTYTEGHFEGGVWKPGFYLPVSNITFTDDEVEIRPSYGGGNVNLEGHVNASKSLTVGINANPVVTESTSSLRAGTSGVKPLDSDRIILEGHTSGTPNGEFITRTLSDMRKWVNDGIAVTEVEGTELSIAAGTSADATTIALSKSGYTPIGCVGFWTTGTNPGAISFNNVHVSGSNLTFRCRNNGSSSTATVKPHFNVLWLKD